MVTQKVPVARYAECRLCCASHLLQVPMYSCPYVCSICCLSHGLLFQMHDARGFGTAVEAHSECLHVCSHSNVRALLQVPYLSGKSRHVQKVCMRRTWHAAAAHIGVICQQRQEAPGLVHGQKPILHRWCSRCILLKRGCKRDLADFLSIQGCEKD